MKDKSVFIDSIPITRNTQLFQFINNQPFYRSADVFVDLTNQNFTIKTHIKDSEWLISFINNSILKIGYSHVGNVHNPNSYIFFLHMEECKMISCIIPQITDTRENVIVEVISMITGKITLNLELLSK